MNEVYVAIWSTPSIDGPDANCSVHKSASGALELLENIAEQFMGEKFLFEPTEVSDLFNGITLILNEDSKHMELRIHKEEVRP